MTNSTNKSFIIHKDSLSILDQLTDEQAGKLFKAIYHYQKTGEIDVVDQLVKIALNPFLNQFERDNQKYEAVIDRNRQNIAKRWNTKNTTGKIGIPNLTKNTYSDSDSDSDSDSKKDSDSKNIKLRHFIKPTLEEVKGYCNELSCNIDPQNFIDYYQSNGWKVGKNSMKDWKATLRQWKSRDRNLSITPIKRPLSKGEETISAIFNMKLS